MKLLIPVLAVLAFSSCTTAYKSGQTPDDVYFSPARPVNEYERMEEETADQRRYREEEEYREDRALRMRVRNRRWSVLDDVDFRYSYQPVFSSYYAWNSPWNPYYSWNYMYNPSCCCMPVVVNPRSTAFTRPRTFNLNSFNPSVVTTPTNPKGGGSAYRSYSTGRGQSSNNGNYRGSGQGAGGFLRGLMGGGSSNSSSGSSSSGAPKASGGSSSSGSSGSSSGGRAGVRRD